MRVLVTDAGYKHTVGIIRSLGSQGHEVFAVSASRFAPGFYSRHTRQHARVDSAAGNPTRFVEEVAERGREWDCDLLIPVGFASCSAVTHNLQKLERSRMKAIVPSGELFDLASDKWAIAEKARDAGLNVPESTLLEDGDAVKSALKTFGRVVCKYRRESYGQGAVYVASEEAAEKLPMVKPIGRDNDGRPNLIAQRHVDGAGAGYVALAWHGHVVREFAHRRRREWPPSGGAATAAESIYDPELIRAGRALIEAIKWHGPAMIEFKANRDGYFFIEFNPKFWGSLELALSAGADFPGDLCRLAGDEDLTARPMPPYEIGLRFWWPWRGDLRRLLRRPRDVGAVLKDLLSRSSRSNWNWRDPWPNLVEMGGEFLYPFRRRG